MIEKHPTLEKLIIHCLHADYGIEVATLTQLLLGADIHALVYEAKVHDHLSYFVKLKRGHHHEIGLAIIELLHDAGIKQVIPPIKTLLGNSFKQVGNFTLIVYPFVKSQDGFSRNLTDSQWVSLGKALRQVHEIDVPAAIQNKIRKEIYSDEWRDAVRSIYDHIEKEPSGDEIASKLLKFMKENKSVIRQLVDRAEQLSQPLKRQSPPYVLCHSDIHGGNVLVDDNHAIYMVDFDEPIMAPKERDLMFIGGGVGNVWNRPTEEKLFYKGYGKTEIDPTSLAYYRHERIVEDIAVYSRELLLKTDGGDNRSEMYRHFIDMFAAQGVVEIALKSAPSCMYDW